MARGRCSRDSFPIRSEVFGMCWERKNHKTKRGNYTFQQRAVSVAFEKVVALFQSIEIKRCLKLMFEVCLWVVELEVFVRCKYG